MRISVFVTEIIRLYVCCLLLEINCVLWSNFPHVPPHGDNSVYFLFPIKILSGLTYQQKIPEIEKSLTLVKHLKAKQEEGETVVTRYNLADTVYTKAELDVDSGIVNLWLGANVMIEYTYDEAIELLSSKEEKAKKDLEDVRILVVFLFFSTIVRNDKYLLV